MIDAAAAARILRRVAAACDLEDLDLDMTVAVFIGNSAAPLRRERLRKLLMEIVADHRRHLWVARGRDNRASENNRDGRRRRCSAVIERGMSDAAA